MQQKFNLRTLGLAAIAIMGTTVAYAPARAQPASVASASLPPVSVTDAPMSRLDAIMQMQLNSKSTEPPPPPMTGAEASLVYETYLKRRSGSSASGSSASGASMSGASSPASSAAASAAYPGTVK